MFPPNNNIIKSIEVRSGFILIGLSTKPIEEYRPAVRKPHKSPSQPPKGQARYGNN